MTANFVMLLLMFYPQPILLLLDRAPWHAGALREVLDETDRLQVIYFPVACPDLNPQEHVWDEVREKEFPNRVFNHLDAVGRQLEQGLPRLANDSQRLRSLTAWPWIISLNLNAH